MLLPGKKLPHGQVRTLPGEIKRFPPLPPYSLYRNIFDFARDPMCAALTMAGNVPPASLPPIAADRRLCPAPPGMPLRACYALPGTDLAPVRRSSLCPTSGPLRAFRALVTSHLAPRAFLPPYAPPPTPCLFSLGSCLLCVQCYGPSKMLCVKTSCTGSAFDHLYRRLTICIGVWPSFSARRLTSCIGV